ncbi:MAG: serine hydrolase domain-containing protein [Chitinophagales bacterium]
MKYLSFILILLAATSCSKQTWEITTSICTLDENTNEQYSKATQLQSIIDKYTKQGIPGIAIAIYSSEGYWASASGYSKIETKMPMYPCNLQYSQSVSKTYMAVAILKLSEEGKINLDEKITNYLPQDVIQKVSGADQMTVRMLLNHTSGVAEYNDDPAYVSYLLEHPLHVFTTMDYLDYIKGKKIQFPAGSKYQYTNTNYLLLALIGDQITGDHAKYIRDEIFKSLGLMHSFYHDDANYLDKPDLVNSYWDRYSNGTIENCSQMQNVNVASLNGDDGMIASPIDYIKFLKGLFEGQLISQSSLDQMLTFVKNDTAKYSYGYGLGIHTDPYKQHPEYGHTGGGIGAGCELGYLPDEKVYFFVALNMGTVISSPITENASNIRDEILDVLME